MESLRGSRRAFWLVPLLAAVGCVVPSKPPMVLRLQWSVEHEDRFIDSRARSVLSLPPELSGDETWWVGPGHLVIEGRALLDDGQRGGRRTWFLLDQGWIVSVDLIDGTVSFESLAAFREERLRQSRALMVATVGAEADSADPGFYRLFQGDLRRERHVSLSGRRWSVVAAVPGRQWLLSGNAPRPLATRPELIALAFDAVPDERAADIGAILAQRSPRIVEEIGLPTEGTSRVVRRVLRSAKAASLEEALEGFPEDEFYGRLAHAAQDRLPLSALSDYLEDRDGGPVDAGGRGLRRRLESVVTPTDIPLIRDALGKATTLERLEELSLLLYAADRAVFEEWIEAAFAAGDLRSLVALISARSLRNRFGLDAIIDRALADDGLWEGRGLGEAHNTRTWLDAVRRWVTSFHEPPPPEAEEVAPERQ